MIKIYKNNTLVIVVIFLVLKMSEENIVISKETVQRLLFDVKDLIKNPLHSENIYYIHDDMDMLKGYALIIGPEDCIYQHGAYFFEFNFPSNYPLQPPVVTYHTNDGVTRFNPNLYRNGKVCISILNTWKGEQWTSCQTIRSVLMTLVTLFHNDPIENEPGFKKTDPESETYNKIIEFKNFDVAINGILNKKYLPEKFYGFFSIYKDYFIENKEKIKKLICDKAIKEPDTEFVKMDLYTMCATINYREFYDVFMQNCYNEFSE